MDEKFLEDARLDKQVKRGAVRMALEISKGMNLDMFNNNGDLPVYDDVEERLNIAYINRDEVPLAMDVFKPKLTEDAKLPVIVTIHGGGLTMGDRKLSRPFGRFLAHRGYLVFSIEYRLVPRANVCQELDDICAGFDVIAGMLPDYNVDADRTYLAAESAGAYLATYVAAMKYSKKLQEIIGYRPGNLEFRAIGLMSGMMYTNRNDPCGWVLSDQIYGKKRMDDEFLQYMNPEHPEIINNLPPAFLITSRGDFINHYSIMMNEALKNAGKTCHLLYYGDKNLQHAFTTTQMGDPQSIEAIDKMLAWFEKQAVAAKKRDSARRSAQRYKTIQRKKMADGSMDDQRIWKYLKERAKADPERLSAPAIIDCTRVYTYAQMYKLWDKYARVFSALKMTGSNRSRVGIAGAITAEPLFSFYGLNITGAEVSMLSYPDFLPGGRWKTMIEKEKITDLIITDIMVTPQMWQEIRKAGKKLGLRNILLVHSLMGGPCVGPAELMFNEFNYHALKRIKGTVFLNDLLDKYADTSIEYGEDGGDHIALITHTSGSTNGTRKPLPYTDKTVNAMGSTMPDVVAPVYHDRFAKGERMRTTLTFDMSSFVNIAGQANLNLAAGNTVVLTFFGFMHPKFIRAIEYYKLHMIFTTSFMIDTWMKLPDIDEVDLSSLKIVGVGGSYLSLEKVKTYREFLKNRGYQYDIARGYGMSEIGGAQLFVPPDCPDDILGYAYPETDYYVLDDEDGKLHCITEGERTGTMYVTSKTMSLNVLDGQELFPVTEIDGRPFVCTNDKIKVNADHSLSYAGRMDKYFVNNDGVRFEAGLVENAIGKLECVSQLAIAPVLDKRIHDTVPVLYVQPMNKNADLLPDITGQLEKIYHEDEKLVGTALPSQIVIIDSIPCTATGKIDTYKVSRERGKGKTYNVVPVYNEDGSLKAVKAEAEENVSTIKAGALPEGMGADSALGLFEAFNADNSRIPSYRDIKKMAKAAKQQRNAMKELWAQNLPRTDWSKLSEKAMQNPEMVKKFVSAAMEMQGVLYRHDIYNHDFED